MIIELTLAWLSKESQLNPTHGPHAFRASLSWTIHTRLMLAYLQEGKDFLLFFSIHIPFLKELKFWDKATTWTHISAMNQSALKRIQIKTRIDILMLGFLIHFFLVYSFLSHVFLFY